MHKLRQPSFLVVNEHLPQLCAVTGTSRQAGRSRVVAGDTAPDNRVSARKGTNRVHARRSGRGDGSRRGRRRGPRSVRPWRPCPAASVGCGAWRDSRRARDWDRRRRNKATIGFRHRAWRRSVRARSRGSWGSRRTCRLNWRRCCGTAGAACGCPSPPARKGSPSRVKIHAARYSPGGRRQPP